MRSLHCCFNSLHGASLHITLPQLHFTSFYRIELCLIAELRSTPSLPLPLPVSFLLSCLFLVFFFFVLFLLLPLLCLACLPLITNQMLVKRASFAPKFCESMSNKRKTFKLKETLQNHFVYSTRIGIVNKLPADRKRERKSGQEREGKGDKLALQ